MTSIHLYGVIGRPSPGRRAKGMKVLGMGIGNPPAAVRLVASGGLAAVVSDLPGDESSAFDDVRSLRRDLAAHADVLVRLLGDQTVLPSRFGVVLPSERAVISQLLEPERENLTKLLRRLDGCVELNVTADYLEDEVLAEVVRERPGLLPARRANNYSDRIELGRRLAAAVQGKRDQDADWLLERLTPFARDVAVTDDRRSDLSVMRASFLIEQRRIDTFDEALERLQADAGRAIRLGCVGPLPPYSFTDLRVMEAAELWDY